MPSEAIKIKVNTDLPRTKFTKQHLLDLLNPSKSHLSPLATIAHIDVNAFFAQVEQIRTGLTLQDPVVCVQWSTLIAVSYAARDYGIGRMDNLQTAKLKCPNLKPIHTATFKKGQDFWRYRDGEEDAFPNPRGYKVSLDPYRRESRKLMRVFKKCCDLVEKASVDESFLDLGRLVVQRLMELWPEFEKSVELLEKGDPLPELPKGLELNTWGHMIGGGEEEQELFINDYDDLLIVIGSIITHEIRQEIEQTLGYTTSCGVYQNKTVAKLASGFKKPNNQTIVLPSQTFQFLNNFQFTDFWSMGGKTGEFLRLKLIPEDEEMGNSIEYIRNNYTLAELNILLDDAALALKLYQMVRGEYRIPVVSKIQLKSMISSKNMRNGSCENVKDSKEWIRIFAVDLYQRLVEIEDEMSKKIRPKTISMSYRSRNQYGIHHSKQIAIQNVYAANDELQEIFYTHGIQLINDLQTQYGMGIFPMANLSLAISNFETLDPNFEVNNIMNFVKKGDAMDGFKELEKVKEREMVEKALQVEQPVNSDNTVGKKAKNLEAITNVFKEFQSGKEVNDSITTEPKLKDVRMQENINKVFQDFKSSIPENPQTTAKTQVKKEPLDMFKNFKKVDNIEEVFKKVKPEPQELSIPRASNSIIPNIKEESKPDIHSLLRTSSTSASPNTSFDHLDNSDSFDKNYEITTTSQIICRKCDKVIKEYEIEEHDDYHFALELSNSFEGGDSDQMITGANVKKPTIKNGNKRVKLEKGQRTLSFSRR
ncbi:hypothetical protein WICPIJ_000958 [Wickerhamomyces pijperi]|uniref:DNA polymerase eta n=1 Tax=Wickerhamomyces pijperi TaxID=599730 RepID=A0A9P8QEL1_WICPI|nr:hypothetical protein WICPIJ_000958 [Wickerhamomyces pijperi]